MRLHMRDSAEIRDEKASQGPRISRFLQIKHIYQF